MIRNNILDSHLQQYCTPPFHPWPHPAPVFPWPYDGWRDVEQERELARLRREKQRIEREEEIARLRQWIGEHQSFLPAILPCPNRRNPTVSDVLRQVR